MNKLILGCGIACLLTCGPATHAQKPIRVDVNLVNVAFTAREANGALVRDLTKDGIELYEDAVPQKIEFFAKSTDVPLTLAYLLVGLRYGEGLQLPLTDRPI